MPKNYCDIHQKHFGRGFAGRGRRRCYNCEREQMGNQGGYSGKPSDGTPPPKTAGTMTNHAMIHPDAEKEIISRVGRYLPVGSRGESSDYAEFLNALKRVCADYMLEAAMLRAQLDELGQGTRVIRMSPDDQSIFAEALANPQLVAEPLKRAFERLAQLTK